MALAGHVGDAARAHNALGDPSPAVRATALGALARLRALDESIWRAGLDDGDAEVRRRACELGPTVADTLGPAAVAAAVRHHLADRDPSVVEAACFAIGELGSSPDGPAGDPLAGGVDRRTLEAVVAVATGHPDPLVREAAVAALGAVGDAAGLPAILLATEDKPAVRRRAVLALAPFEGPEVDDALQRALSDRDWQVRQAAEDLTQAAADGP